MEHSLSKSQFIPTACAIDGNQGKGNCRDQRWRLLRSITGWHIRKQAISKPEKSGFRRFERGQLIVTPFRGLSMILWMQLQKFIINWIKWTTNLFCDAKANVQRLCHIFFESNLNEIYSFSWYFKDFNTFWTILLSL